MKLAVAIALLSRADAHAFRKAEASAARGLRNSQSELYLPTDTSDRQKLGASKHPGRSSKSPRSRRLKFLEWTKKESQTTNEIRNEIDLKQSSKIECDPLSSSPDSGLLSCGQGLYCRESTESSLGGVCQSLPSANRSDSRNLLSEAVPAERRGNSLFETLSFACETTDYCDCSEFDFDSFQGIVECTTLKDYCSQSENYCGEDVELCYTLHSTLEANSHDDYSYTTCMTYTRPYQQRVCVSYDTKDTESCAIDFNNNMCSSCTPELRTYEDSFEQNGTVYTYSYTERCLQFDCADNEGGHSGNTCDRNVATIQYNIVFGDDCARCLACGMGFKMTKPQAMADFPLIGQYECSGLELGSILGYFDRALCNKIQAATFDTCGCKPLFYDPDFVDQNGISESLGESCSICGDASAIMTRPDATLILPSSVKTCSEVAAEAMMGQFSSVYCADHIQPEAITSCGCHTPLQPIDGAVFHDGALSTPLEPTVSPTITRHPAAEEDSAQGGFACEICGPSGVVSNPDTFVSLANGVTTCSGLEAAGLAGHFNETQCLQEIVPLATNHSCCELVLSPSSAPAVPADDQISPPVEPPVKIGSQRLDSPERYQFQNKGSFPEKFRVEVCHICGPGKAISKNLELVDLPEGVTTCESFAQAGLAKVFTKSFCDEQAHALAEEHCGCVSPESTGLQFNALSSGQSQSAHQEIPDEANVGADSNESSIARNPLASAKIHVAIAIGVAVAVLVS